MFRQQKQTLAERARGNWEVTHDGLFRCGCCGARVEEDGNCPAGVDSPMVQLGLI